MKEIPPHKQPEEKVAPLKLEESLNILIKKQVEVTRKDEEIINDEFRKQKVMKLILDQPIEELKEVSKVSEESMFDLPRPLMISSSFLVTLTCFLIRIFDGSSSFRVLLFPLVAYVVEFPSLYEGSSFAHCAQVCKCSHSHHVGPFHQKAMVFQA